MRKIILAASGLALLASGSAFAANLHMLGQVAPVCEVTGLTPTASFSSMTAGATVSSPVTLKCNDGDGANVKVISAEGGMESDDVEDLSIEYRATLSFPGGPVVLETTLGVGLNDEFADLDVSGSSAFAAGFLGTLGVELTTSATFSGGYSDTITIEISAI